ncbi:hypothetical protein BDV38DRAFT_291177 [Aspergillus pseudotamarii]|uniref:Uncharacterized protein n=1 Tax=Aspergillus pseudotamarii TaxID=132259 RepID=A0A5N6S8F7_ASPPS|nr:uncharacterized protein BDV38DRAFT_291177 [Aspergillus pseudotamarii]KAE8130865.1 hypothetical protein BDV38DRAFT_291177 [Aspergillus pseudotamarii]
MYTAFKPDFALFPIPISPLEWVHAIDKHVGESLSGEELLRGVKRPWDQLDTESELRSTQVRRTQESLQPQFRSLLDMPNRGCANDVNTDTGSATEAGRNRTTQEERMSIITGNTAQSNPSSDTQNTATEENLNISTDNNTQSNLSSDTRITEENGATEGSLVISADNNTQSGLSSDTRLTEQNGATGQDNQLFPEIYPTEEEGASEEESVYSSTANTTPGEPSPEIYRTDRPGIAGAEFDRMLQEFGTSTGDQEPDLLPQTILRDMTPTMTDIETLTSPSISSTASSRDLLERLPDYHDHILPQWPLLPTVPMASDLETDRNRTLSTHSALPIDDVDMIVNNWRMPENVAQAVIDILPATHPIPGTETPTINIAMTEDRANNPNDCISLQDTIVQQWPDRHYIMLYGTLLTRANVEQLLYELQDSPSLSIFTVDLLGDRLSYNHHPSELHIADATWFNCLHRGILRLTPMPQTLLLPNCLYNHWSLIEIQPYSGTVIHYSFPEIRPEVQDSSYYPHHPACPTCQAAIQTLSNCLQDIGQPCPEWQLDSKIISSVPGDDGTALIWTMTQRANNKGLQNGPPETFRVHLAQDILTEALQAATDTPSPPPPQPPPGLSPKSSLSSPVPPRGQQTNSLEKAHYRWSTVMIRSGDPVNLTDLWDRVAQMSMDSGTPIGRKQADRLLQLAFTIASPPVLVEVKRQLEHLRREQCNTTRRFQRSAAGVFAAGIWHKNNEHTSRIGLILTYWYVHNYRQQQGSSSDPITKLATDIYNHLPEVARDYGEVEEKVRDWCRRAWPWRQLVRITGSPNVLCFLPQGIAYFPGEDAPSTTEYRCLKKPYFKAIEVIFQQCRPQLLKSIPEKFFEIFLYNHLPEAKYAIEQWTEEEILAEPLDSDKFSHAFDLVSDH